MEEGGNTPESGHSGDMDRTGVPRWDTSAQTRAGGRKREGGSAKREREHGRCSCCRDREEGGEGRGVEDDEISGIGTPCRAWCDHEGRE